ncbi:MAG: fused MFS/spermidine synthase [Bryobacter sp.]|nr:fused MFS/spermidine synthase [Bryobacter sp.]
MPLYAVTVFLSAFLLFQVQPIIAKVITPWFGGSAMVWTACMLFFQVVLLAGYFYAHYVVTRLTPAKQTALHLGLLGASVLWLPLRGAAFLKPTGTEEPVLRILLVLGASVGLPYFLLSTTGPLMQAWYARRFHQSIPYRLFALSNLASLLALVAYPFAIEPWVSTAHQALIWTFGYAVFLGLCAMAAWMSVRSQDGAEAAATEDAAAPGWSEKLLWIALAAFPSMLFLAMTNHLCQNVAAVPFLWILPLSVYLLSFVFAFDHARWYHPRVFSLLMLPALGLIGWHLWKESSDHSLLYVVPGYLGALFVWCLFGHGELSRRKPAPQYLTTFYLMLSIGGAVGGLLVSVAAPNLLPGNYDFAIAVAAYGFFVMLYLYKRWWVTDVAWAVMAIYLLITAGVYIRSIKEDARIMQRNFYGMLRVRDYLENGMENQRSLIHGTINHGEQWLAPERRRWPTTYYGRRSGVGLALTELRSAERPALRAGLIGLGAGTLAAYCRPGDRFTFYEINPLVEQLARKEFYYLKEAPEPVEVVLGDARLTMEREAPRGYDVIAVDAFSGDSIPVHLLTREAFRLYFRHLRPDGVLVVHISNKHLSLRPVVEQLAAAFGKPARLIENEEDDEAGVFESDWVVISAPGGFADREAIRALASKPAPEKKLRMWTDDYSNLFQILK